MANTKQSKKRARRNVKARMVNKMQYSAMKTALKSVNTCLDKKDLPGAKESYLMMLKKVSSLVHKRLVHRNRLSRLASKFNARIKALHQNVA